MKVWITRDTAGSVMAGGLERLHVNFSKPVYLLEVYTDKERDTPWGYETYSHGYYRTHGWRTNGKLGNLTLSFGKWLGYSDIGDEHQEIAIYVWHKLEEHFLNEPFRNWDEIERAGKVKIEDFLLEIDLSITLQPNVFETGLDEYINTLSKEQLIEAHKIHKKFLDEQYNKNYHEMYKTYMLMEQKFRKAAYPEYNEIPLTYLELRELNNVDNLKF